MLDHTFSNRLRISAYTEPYASIDELANTNMLYSAAPTFAMDHGGPLTKRALHAIGMDHSPVPGRWPVIDTRVHMLMPGMIPAIPGWHADDVPRSDTSNGQPDLRLAEDVEAHYVVTFATKDLVGANTEFVVDPITVAYSKSRVWGSVNDAVVAASPVTRHVPHGAVGAFTDSAVHRATAAKSRGWRFFLRLSYMRSAPQNKIRRQVQVYTTESNGW